MQGKRVLSEVNQLQRCANCELTYYNKPGAQLAALTPGMRCSNQQPLQHSCAQWPASQCCQLCQPSWAMPATLSCATDRPSQPHASYYMLPMPCHFLPHLACCQVSAP
jgi:hypothetical protein